MKKKTPNQNKPKHNKTHIYLFIGWFIFIAQIHHPRVWLEALILSHTFLLQQLTSGTTSLMKFVKPRIGSMPFGHILLCNIWLKTNDLTIKNFMSIKKMSEKNDTMSFLLINCTSNMEIMLYSHACARTCPCMIIIVFGFF